MNLHVQMEMHLLYIYIHIFMCTHRFTHMNIHAHIHMQRVLTDTHIHNKHVRTLLGDRFVKIGQKSCWKCQKLEGII